MGIRAFRDTQRQVEETVEIVEGLLSCEFLVRLFAGGLSGERSLGQRAAVPRTPC